MQGSKGLSGWLRGGKQWLQWEAAGVSASLTGAVDLEEEEPAVSVKCEGRGSSLGMV